MERGLKCMNTPGTYMCVCCEGLGIVPSPDLRCEDIDECAEGTHTCNENAPCTNVNHTCNSNLPKYECTCKEGFVYNGYACEDIDECQITPEVCPIENKLYCVNTIGSYLCECCSGYEFNETSPVQQCKRKKNLCAEGVNPCHALAKCTYVERECNASLPAYTCQCYDEYHSFEFDGQCRVRSTLLTLSSRSNMEFQDLWSSSLNDDTMDKHLWPLPLIIKNGNYRSAKFALSHNIKDDKISIIGANINGDVLWETEFNVWSGCTYDLAKWFSGVHIHKSSAQLPGSQSVALSGGNYDMRVIFIEDEEKSWFAISKTLLHYGPFPLIFAAKKPDIPFTNPVIHDAYFGCYPENAMINLTDKGNFEDMTPKKCIDVCEPFFNVAYITRGDKPYRCHCAIFDDQALGTEDPQYCGVGCPGDTDMWIRSECGGFFNAWGSVYRVQDTLPGAYKDVVLISRTVTSPITEEIIESIEITGSAGEVVISKASVQSTVKASFTFHYSVKPCDPPIWWKQFTKEKFLVNGDINVVGPLRTHCVKLVFNTTINNGEITLYGPPESTDHIDVPVVIVQEHKIAPECKDFLMPTVPNADITSSTYASLNSKYDHSPPSSRLDTPLQTKVPRINDGRYAVGWAPEQGDIETPWIQAKFGVIPIIVKVITQGAYKDCSNAYTCEEARVTTYMFRYSLDCVSFDTVRNETGDAMIFIGTRDYSNTHVISILPEPIKAKCIRLYPLTYVLWPFLRFDVLGCKL